MRLLLIGAPGAGKGTQAERLAERFNITHISSGDLLRRHVKDQTSIGQTIKAYVDAGDLVPFTVDGGPPGRVVTGPGWRARTG
jgi:adenylate kinase